MEVKKKNFQKNFQKKIHNPKYYLEYQRLPTKDHQGLPEITIRLPEISIRLLTTLYKNTASFLPPGEMGH